MRVTFYTLGCKVNQNETGALAQLFEENGYTVVSNEEGADVYIVNSCTVTNFGDQKSRKWLRRAKRENPGAVTVLTGCYPQAFPDDALILRNEHSDEFHFPHPLCFFVIIAQCPLAFQPTLCRFFLIFDCFRAKSR